MVLNFEEMVSCHIYHSAVFCWTVLKFTHADGCSCSTLPTQIYVVYLSVLLLTGHWYNFLLLLIMLKWTFWYMSSVQMCNSFSRGYTQEEQCAFKLFKESNRLGGDFDHREPQFPSKEFSEIFAPQECESCLSQNTKIYYSGKLYFKIGLTLRRPKASLKFKETHLREQGLHKITPITPLKIFQDRRKIEIKEKRGEKEKNLE